MAKMIDLTGQRFGHLVAIKPTEKRAEKGTSVFWLCECDCGNQKEISGQSLRDGRTTSCGCMMGVCRKTGTRKGAPQKDLTGKRFGRLTAIRSCGKHSDGQFLWECVCDCGKTTTVPTSLLTSGQTQSCGCLRRERIIESRYVDAFREKQRQKSLETWDESEANIGMQDDTNISLVKSKKARVDSSTGVRGVHFQKDKNSYRVELKFRKKVYREYGYKTIEDAAKARERMWKTYVLPYLESVGRAD